MSTSAMPLMPMPPMPTKWIGPISLGSFMLSFPVYVPGSARRDATSWRCCHSQHQIRQPLGGVGGTLRPGSRGHCYELLRRTGMKDGKLANVEFDTIPNVKDPWKELNPPK